MIEFLVTPLLARISPTTEAHDLHHHVGDLHGELGIFGLGVLGGGSLQLGARVAAAALGRGTGGSALRGHGAAVSVAAGFGDEGGNCHSTRKNR